MLLLCHCGDLFRAETLAGGFGDKESGEIPDSR